MYIIAHAVRSPSVRSHLPFNKLSAQKTIKPTKQTKVATQFAKKCLCRGASVPIRANNPSYTRMICLFIGELKTKVAEHEKRTSKWQARQTSNQTESVGGTGGGYLGGAGGNLTGNWSQNVV